MVSETGHKKINTSFLGPYIIREREGEGEGAELAAAPAGKTLSFSNIVFEFA